MKLLWKIKTTGMENHAGGSYVILRGVPFYPRAAKPTFFWILRRVFWAR